MTRPAPEARRFYCRHHPSTGHIVVGPQYEHPVCLRCEEGAPRDPETIQKPSEAMKHTFRLLGIEEDQE